MALFNRHFVKEGVLPIELGRFYSRVFDRRLQSDYGKVIKPSEEDVRADLEKARESITRIESLLESV